MPCPEGTEQAEGTHLGVIALLVYGSQDYVLRSNDRIAVAELRGRNILLYLDYLDLYDELLTWYHEIKAKDPDFEVVFVRLDNRNTTEVEDDLVLSAPMPWLVCPFDPDHSASLQKNIFTKAWPYDALVEF